MSLAHTCPICGGRASINTEATLVRCEYLRCKAVTPYPYRPVERPLVAAGPNRPDEMPEVER